MHWLSDKENGNAYGSMVIYVTKASDARRLLEERYFHLAGESASTNVFERRQGPAQCYNCWETGHKAFACSKTQRCGKCAEKGHRYRDCQAAKYLKPGDETNGDKVPPLKRADGTTTQDKVEQVEELLSVFLPPLPADIEDEGPRPRRREVAMPNLTMEEVEEKVMEAKAWKAPGQDGLPAIVWKELWSVVKEQVLHLFHTSLSEG
jgi:hypothetical protein